MVVLLIKVAIFRRKTTSFFLNYVSFELECIMKIHIWIYTLFWNKIDTNTRIVDNTIYFYNLSMVMEL